MVTRGFTGRNRPADLGTRLPPGQSLTEGFPVLSAGPTPRISTEKWRFALKDGPRPITSWNWAEFNALPQTKMTRDIHGRPTLRRPTDPARSWRPGATARAASLFLEIGKMDQRPPVH